MSLGHYYPFDFTSFGHRARKGLCLFLSHRPFWSLNTNHSQMLKKGRKEVFWRVAEVTGMRSLTVSLRTVARQRRPGGST